jgi:hypothetical protein
MTDQSRLPRISVTKGFEVHCDQHGVVAFVETMVEAKAEAAEHRQQHRDG